MRVLFGEDARVGAVSTELGSAESLRPAAAIAVRAIADGVILVNLETGRCWELNAVGALVWERLSQGASRGEIAAAVAEKYAIGLETARADTEALLTQLVSEGIVDRPERSDPADVAGPR
jgi:hypothetical protein